MKKAECKFEENKDVASVTSSRISSIARAVAYPENEEKLIEVVKALTMIEAPFVVLGRMSNVLLKDNVYDGVIIKTTKIATKSLAENKITLSCGVNLGGVIRSVASKNLGGMEGLCGIPGTVGGMVKQNAGAFGYEISDRFKEAICYDAASQKMRRLSLADMCFSYRDSVLAKQKMILINATFELIPKKRDDVLCEINCYKAKRLESQPLEYPSLGSIFKRYCGIGAGYYVDRAGLKGYSIGGACVSDKHAGFIINMGGATSDDYLRLIDYVKRRVYSVFGIELEEEIEII